MPVRVESSLRSNHTPAKMSRETSPRDSESSSSSPNAVYMLRSDKETSDLILFGQLVAKHQRSATVRRASSAAMRNKQDSFAKSQDDLTMPAHPPPERGYRRSLDSTYRQSLESISEYKTKSSFSTTSLGRDAPDSTHSDCTDYATRSATRNGDGDGMHNKTLTSPTSASYLSWIESVSSSMQQQQQQLQQLHSATPTKLLNTANTTPNPDMVDVDSKVGEWNNFWLNYNNPTNRYGGGMMQNQQNQQPHAPYAPYAPYASTIPDDDMSDCKSTCSTQREFNDKLAGEQVTLTLEELQEALHCAQKTVDILQKALKRSDNDIDLLFIERSRHDSYYSQQTISYNEDNYRDRFFSFDAQQQQATPRVSLKPQVTTQQPQPTSNSCINALMNTGVADILKRVLNKRREVLTSEEGASTTRSSFSEWSTGAK